MRRSRAEKTGVPSLPRECTQLALSPAETGDMTAKSASSLAFAALLANLAVVATGCGAFDGDSSSKRDPQNAREDAPAATTPGSAPTAPPVGGPAKTDELTDAFGIFVSPRGNDSAEGSHLRPLATIQAGIEAGKKVGKRVYVCSGTFHEALTIANSISVIGGLDCTNDEWRVGGVRTRIESPTSPAMRAANITSATRIEGLEVLAPDATATSGSSFALIADHSSALVIASSKLVAGNAKNGTDGTDGIQLANSATADGTPALTTGPCDFDTCTAGPGGWVSTGLVPGGTNLCLGAPGHEAQPGGAGGSGGVYGIVNEVSAWYFRPYASNLANVASVGITSRTSAVGGDGTNGTSAPALGSFSADGYIAARGTAGSDGTNGLGGAGGSGTSPEVDVNPNGVAAQSAWRGPRGASGGAGGCAGLAGTPGEGGGASIAALLLESAVRFEGSTLVSSKGGDAGRGAMGSLPTAGGQPNNSAVASHPTLFGKAGGHGGAAGTSGNGSNGPSFGIAYVGAKPDVGGDTTVTAGTGGTAIDARSRINAFGLTTSIPATPAGLSRGVFAL